MSRTADAIRRLREALVETADALSAVSKVLDETEPFYFELFRQREQVSRSLDEKYMESWEQEQELQTKVSNLSTVETQLQFVRQEMTDILDSLSAQDNIEET